MKTPEKIFAVLECFSEKEPTIGITEISNKLGLYKSNVHNILTSLEKMGYVEKTKNSKKYFLGKNFIKLSRIAVVGTGFDSNVRNTLKAISNEVKETVYYGVPDGNNVIYLEGAYPDNAYNSNVILGVTAPLACTGIGKAILAFMSDIEIEKISSLPIEQFTEFTITEKNKLKRELILTKERGYSIDNMEHEYGIKCVGVPVFNKYDEVVAGISVTGPSLRFTDERIIEIANILKMNTPRISIE